jgi:subtilisin family serine protease
MCRQHYAYRSRPRRSGLLLATLLLPAIVAAIAITATLQPPHAMHHASRDVVLPTSIAPAAAAPALAVPQTRGAAAPDAPWRAPAAAATSLIGADRWQEAGFSGHGVRVAVLDAGFAGYQEALSVTLPERLVTRSFRTDRQMDGGTDHGLRAAEIVHEIAPRAQLYLVNFSTLPQLEQAIDYLVAEEVAIVSFSLGYIHNGPGDGSGPVDDIITRGAEAGQLWTVAAGNWAEQQWSGIFDDTDGDSLHEFAPGVNRVRHHFEAGDLITVSLRWDDPWGAACTDLDVELFAPDGSLVRAGRDLQDCRDDPVEKVQVLATQSGSFSVRVSTATSEPTTSRVSLLVIGSPDRGAPLDIRVARGSLAEPADHPLVLTIGALGPITSEGSFAAAFSSRGPTSDGRLKPNLVAPTGLPSLSLSGFAGTSAAAPHAAGAAALLREALPFAGRDVLTRELLDRAFDLNAPGADAETGAGALNLGSLSGFGLLRPTGAEEASFDGVLPEGAGFAVITYSGPDGYPARFAHLLTAPGREPLALLRPDGAGSFTWYIPGAPALVQGISTIDDGDVLLLRFGAMP